ncbi:hypothetical protein Bca4012_099271 [Brassica carinata]|uniref:Uncharacterized protein n=4 Tax=Brassica TaxID=3705 RepID=A0A0D3CT06_BRAOL|nr:hypothetical protein Bca52824_081907 [Brassica carinata]CAF2057880.1 unnamed protein product [Brassica napus]CDY65332.1 BnaCnng46650D [Brassica napus]VDD61633.1 unnamed protein product [Brassica oleracea]
MNSTERKDDKDESSTFYDTATKVIGVVGAIGAAASLFSWMTSGSDENGPKEKMMKAPGGNGSIIPRAPFEANPRDHFKNQRQLNKK